MKIFAIESSCDDTSVAFIKCSGGLKHPKFQVISEITASQIKTHRKFGGVIPEVAAREHAVHIAPAVEKITRGGKIKPDFLAVTNGPGLITSLLVGTAAAKTLSWIWKIPVIGINHIEGHIYSALLRKDAKIKFPALALVASGGHTELIVIKDYLDYKIIGATLDDASGECFDKIAKMVGLPYPGGPEISKLANKFYLSGKKTKNILPRPIIHVNNFNFSFAGLKTAALYYLRDNRSILKNKNELSEFAAEAERAIVDCLVFKTIKAAGRYKPKTLLLGGGVSANNLLNAELKKNLPENTVFFATEKKYTMDNAAMIGAAAYLRILKKGAPDLNSWKKLKSDPALKLRN